ncbi:MAG: hypothetical protein R3C44_02905 [Chloroflexota bacterium]
MTTSTAARRLWLLLLIVLAMAACRSQTPTLPAVGEQAVLVCSEECAARGQCGTVNNSDIVVLANEGGPAVKFQDRYFSTGTLVTLAEVSEREVIAARDGAPLTGSATPFPHSFFLAQDEGGKSAWVSSWCVARPEN